MPLYMLLKNDKFIFIFIFVISFCSSCVNSNNLFSEVKTISDIYQLKNIKNELVSIKKDEIIHNGESYKRFVYKDDVEIVFDGYFRYKNDTLFFMPYHSISQSCFDELFFLNFVRDGYIGNSCQPKTPGTCFMIDQYVNCIYMGTYNDKGIVYERFRHQIMTGDHYLDTITRAIAGERIYFFNFKSGIVLESEIKLSDGEMRWYGY